MAAQTGRSGGFAAFNTGKIKNCYCDVSLHTGGLSGGFCGENRGSLSYCFGKGRLRRSGKAPGCGLCARQEGSMDHCFWVRQEEEQPDAQVWKDGGNSVSPQEFRKSADQLLNGWDRDGVWNLDQDGQDYRIGLYDRSADHRSRNQTVEIDSKDELLAMVRDINEGRSGEGVLYRLTADIDLKGADWTPIGLDENAPFLGCFDGQGHTVRGFRVNARSHNYAGFFGYVGGRGEIHSLKLDGMVRGKGAYVGALCGMNQGTITNCVVSSGCHHSRYSGGFVGQNAGTILQSCVLGTMGLALPFPIWLPALLLALLLCIPPLGFAYTANREPADEVFAPVIVDPNAQPIDPTDPTVPQKPAEPTDPQTQKPENAAFIMGTEIVVSRENYTGHIGLRCPKWSDKGFVATATVRADDLRRNGAAYAEDAVIYQSGLLEPDYGIDLITLSPLPDGSKLPAGEYELSVQFSFYDPDTNECSSIDSSAPLKLTVR